MADHGLLATAVPWLILLLVAAIALLVGILFDKIVLHTVRGLAKRTRSDLDDIVLAAIHPAIGVFVTLLALHAGLRILARHLPPGTVAFWETLTLAFGILLGGLMVARLAAGLLRYGARRRPRYHVAARLGSRIVSIAVYVVALLVVLDTYGISITPLVTSLGIAGLAVALALQDTLSNFFAGVWMQTGKALQPGHYVRLEEHKLEGFVEEVGWRTTKIRQLANNIVVVPNSKLAQAVVIDYNLPEARMGVSVTFLVAHDTDVPRALAAMLEEARAAGAATPGMLLDPPPGANCKEVTAEGILLWLGFQVQDFVAQFEAQNQVRLRVLQRFRAEGVRLAQPVREVRVTSLPEGMLER